jgi:excisionase family DNA binding protein
MSRWITVNEAARATQHSRQWVHNRIKDGTFKAERKGRRVDVNGDSVQAWMVAEMQRIKDLWKFYYHHLPNGYHGEPEED